MLRSLSCTLLLFAGPAAASAAELPKPLVEGMVNPESVAIGPDGKMYVSVIGEFDKDGDGSIVRIENGKPVTVVSGLDDPKGIAFFQRFLFIADKTRVLRVDLGAKGGGLKVDQFAPPNAFPVDP